MADQITDLLQKKLWNSVELVSWCLVSNPDSFRLGPVELIIKKGQITGILGSSGAGKSMLIRSLFGILPDGYNFSQESRIRIHSSGDESVDLQAAALGEEDWTMLRRHLWAYLPQDPVPSFDPVKKLGRQFRLLEHSYGLNRGSGDQILDQLELDPEVYLDRYPHQLSGGQAQRLAFALSGKGDPAILVADEPTASLDKQLAGVTAKMIGSWVDVHKAAFVCSHDLEFMERICNVLFVLDDGKIVEAGTAKDVLSKPGTRVTRELVEARLTKVSGADKRSLLTDQPISIYAERVTMNYERSGQPALDAIDLKMEGPHRLGIFGSSGSGKSTLARIVAGITTPTSGTIRINGHSIDFSDPMRFTWLSEQVQYIAQDPYSSFSPNLSIEQTFREIMAMHWRDKEPAERQQIILGWMEDCRLDRNLLNRKPGTLSGGERQRFSVIRALLCRPKLLILDEVTAALDHLSRKRLLDLLLKLADDHGFSFWVISHDPDVIGYMCHEQFEISGGQAREIHSVNIF